MRADWPLSASTTRSVRGFTLIQISVLLAVVSLVAVVFLPAPLSVGTANTLSTGKMNETKKVYNTIAKSRRQLGISLPRDVIEALMLARGLARGFADPVELEAREAVDAEYELEESAVPAMEAQSSSAAPFDIERVPRRPWAPRPPAPAAAEPDQSDAPFDGEREASRSPSREAGVQARRHTEGEARRQPGHGQVPRDRPGRGPDCSVSLVASPPVKGKGRKTRC